jgi:hypothetical protein
LPLRLMLGNWAAGSAEAHRDRTVTAPIQLPGSPEA